MSMALLEEVVNLSGAELEAEDRRIRDAVHGRGEHGGLVLRRDERYYQYITWRAVLPRWHTKLEQGGRDMVIWAEGVEHHFEMKNWRAYSPGILQNDIKRLAMIPRGGYFLVFSD